MIGRRFSKLAAATGLLLSTAATIVDHSVASAATTTSSVTGTVFRDDDYSGTKGARERGQGGVIVTAYDARNKLVGSTSSAALTGAYTLPVTAAYSSGVRVHFEIPASMSTLKPAGHSSPIDQFVDVATPATGVNFALTDPRDYCQSNPKLLSACWKYGDQSNNRSALVSYSALNVGATTTGGYVAPRAEATENQIGTTFGAAYSNDTATLFVSAYTRRHAGFGPAGTGAIYKVTGAGSTAAVSTYADLNALFGAGTAGANTHPSGASGSVSSTSPASANLWWHDVNSYDAVGKSSLGAMKLSKDNANLFVVNLTDRQLYRMSATTAPTSASAVTRVAIPQAGSGTAFACPAGDSRPFGLGLRAEKGYAGVVCSAQSSQDATKLRGYVYAFDPTSMVFESTPVVSIDLGAFSVNRPGSAGSPDNWRPWTNLIPTSGYQDYSQAMISDITFDGDDMVIGLRDRFGDQLADGGGTLSTTDNNPVYLDAWGDIIRACATASGLSLEVPGVRTAGGSFTNGSCGGTSYSRVRYYSGGGNEAQYVNGSLFQIPGADGVMSSSMDPASFYGIWDHTGVATISHTTGLRTAGYAFTQGGVSTLNGLFGKGNGMGAIAAMCDKAPLEIGGRLWNDTNGSGIQDAGEAALPNVSVNLLNSADTVVATAVSDAKGLYSFSNKTATSTTSSIYGVTTLTPGSTGWKVRMILTDPDIPGGLFPTGQNVAADESGDVSRSSVIGLDGKSDPFAVGGSSFINQYLGMGMRSILADCNSASIGRSLNRALLVNGNATLSGLNTTGSVAVGGSITMTGGAVATGLPVDATRIDLASNNNVTLNTVNVSRGNYSYANSKSGSGTTTAGSVVPLKQTSPWISSAFTTAQSAASYWATKASNGTTTKTVPTPAAGQTYSFSGTDSLINVFDITSGELQATKHINISIPKGSVAVINVKGGSTFTSSTWMDINYVGLSAADPADARSGLSWNFVGTTAVTLAGAAPEGLILAPSAALTSTGSTLKGSAVVASVTNAGTIQFAPSKLSCVTAPPVVLDGTATASSTVFTCNTARDDWKFNVAGVTNPPVSMQVTWADGFAWPAFRVLWDGTTAVYKTAYNPLHKVVSGISLVVPPGDTPSITFTGNCEGTAPELGICLEGAIGAPATTGRFKYKLTTAVLSDSYFRSTVNDGGDAPFDAAAGGAAGLSVSADWTKSTARTLKAAPIKWTLEGTYFGGKIMPTTAIDLPAAGTAVDLINACTPPVVGPVVAEAPTRPT